MHHLQKYIGNLHVLYQAWIFVHHVTPFLRVLNELKLGLLNKLVLKFNFNVFQLNENLRLPSTPFSYNIMWFSCVSTNSWCHLYLDFETHFLNFLKHFWIVKHNNFNSSKSYKIVRVLKNPNLVHFKMQIVHQGTSNSMKKC